MEGSWPGRHVLVTGGLGFLGSNFVVELLARGAYVSATTRKADARRCARLPSSDRLRIVRLDPLDEAELRAALRAAPQPVDAVFHCAGLGGNAEFKRRNSAQILDVNVRLASHVLNAAREMEVPTTVIAGSADVLEDPAAADVRDGYTLANRFSEFQAGLFHERRGMRVFMPRFTGLYGPRDHFGPGARVIPAMLTRVLAGDPVEVWDDGDRARSFMYVSDAVRAALQVLARGRDRVVTIGTAETVSIPDLRRLIFELAGRPERIAPVRAGNCGTGGSPPDVSVMNRLIDFTPRTLREGIAETVRWYRAESAGALTGAAGL
jgi:dTDP-4-dehydro-6-deoxy-alpha-D-gulose 4-ketoreductase